MSQLMPEITTWFGLIAAVVIAIIGGFVAVIVAKINKGVRAINRAVNHSPEGAPTLVQRVSLLELHGLSASEWQQQSFRLVADQLGVKLPPAPAVVLYIPATDE